MLFGPFCPAVDRVLFLVFLLYCICVNKINIHLFIHSFLLQYQTERLAAKKVTEMTYSLSSGGDSVLLAIARIYRLCVLTDV